MNREEIALYVEECVSNIVSEKLKKEIKREDLYKGVTKIPFSVATVRHFVYYVLKDTYCLPYSYIAKHCGMTIGAIMKNVRKMREVVFFDDFYNDINNAIRKKILKDYAQE